MSSQSNVVPYVTKLQLFRKGSVTLYIRFTQVQHRFAREVETRDKTHVITMQCVFLSSTNQKRYFNLFNARFEVYAVVLTETHLFWDWVFNTQFRCKHLWETVFLSFQGAIIPRIIWVFGSWRRKKKLSPKRLQLCANLYGVIARGVECSAGAIHVVTILCLLISMF
jgi:hypothetical protein